MFSWFMKSYLQYGLISLSLSLKLCEHCTDKSSILHNSMIGIITVLVQIDAARNRCCMRSIRLVDYGSLDLVSTLGCVGVVMYNYALIQVSLVGSVPTLDCTERGPPVVRLSPRVLWGCVSDKSCSVWTWGHSLFVRVLLLPRVSSHWPLCMLTTWVVILQGVLVGFCLLFHTCKPVSGYLYMVNYYFCMLLYGFRIFVL